MWLVLTQDNDLDAPWIASGLRARDGRPVVVATGSTLVHDCRWEHRVSPHGATAASSRLVLGDGTVLDATTIDAVVNRLGWLGAEGFAGASARDREYATGELFALGLSWLESLGGRVVNRPAPTGLSGGWRQTVEWRSVARSVGLAALPYDSDEPEAMADPGDDLVLVVDGQVVASVALAGAGAPAVEPRMADGLGALAAAVGADGLEVRLAAGTGGGPAVRWASFQPTQRLYGDAGLDALYKALVARVEVGP
jgi:hypothetical protein